MRSLGLGKRELGVLAGYCLIVSVMVHFYQPWEDEGRAWMLARSYGLIQLVFQTLRYETHPALWYVILWVPSHLHVPFIYINVLSAAIGCSAIYVLLRFSPFPFFVRALLPFGFALAYGYSVVARSYVLFPLLGFVAAHLYRRRPATPVAMAVALGLLANVSLHGTLVAIGFALAYIFRIIQEKKSAPAYGPTKQTQWISMALFGFSLLFVAICIRPAPGLNPTLSPTMMRLYRSIAPASPKAVSTTSMFVGHGKAEKAQQRPPKLLRVAWQADHPTASLRHRFLVRLNETFVYPVAAWLPVALFFECLIIYYLYRRRKLELLLPVVLLSSFLVTIYAKVYHLGLVWVTLLLILWAAWEDAGEQPPSRLQSIVAYALGLVALLQIPWTYGAMRYDLTSSTYPAESTARYLLTLPPKTRLYGREYAFTVLPYFSFNPFANYPADSSQEHALWPHVSGLQKMIEEEPDAIVLRDDSESPGGPADVLTKAGYRESRSFCGAPYYPERPIHPLCLRVFLHPSE